MGIEVWEGCWEIRECLDDLLVGWFLLSGACLFFRSDFWMKPRNLLSLATNFWIVMDKMLVLILVKLLGSPHDEQSV